MRSANGHYTVTSPVPRAVWESLYRSDEKAVVSQSLAWRDSLLADGRYQDASLLYEFPSGRQVLMPMARRRLQPPGATAVASWPQVWGIGGPITQAGQVSPVEAAAVLGDVARRGTLSAAITLRPDADRNWLSQARQFRVEDRGCYVLDLDGGFGEVWQHKFRSNTRRAVRKAERSGLEIEVDRSGRLLDVFYDLYQKSLSRWAAVQHEPLWFTRLRMNRVCYTTPRHLALVARHFGADCAIWVAWHKGQPAAANIILRAGTYVKAWRGAMDKEIAAPVCATELLDRLAIEDACQEGYRFYDLGGAEPGSSLARFKENLGATLRFTHELRAERLPVSRARRLSADAVSSLVSRSAPGRLSRDGGTVRIVCVGGGPAGLYFSLLMKREDHRHDITVFERNRVGSSFGWGVTIDPGFLQKLYSNDPESARQIEQAAFRWRKQYIHINGEQVTYDGDGDLYNFNRPDLVDVLAARAQRLGIRVEYEHEVMSASQLPEADLIVAADGVNSRIRQENPNFGTDVWLSNDKYIWLGTDKVFDTFSYHFIKTDGGWLWASTYGVGSELSTFVVHTSSETWKALGFDSMPIRDSLSVLSELFQDQLEGHRLMGQVGDEANARWLSFRNVSNQRWHVGNVVLAGDSAHTTHFSAGEGTRLAIEDSITLAENVQRHDDLEVALESYERQRRAEMRRTQNEARLSAQWFENLSRYIDLEPRQFGALVHARRSALLPLLPPRLFYHLNHASQEIGILRQIRRRVGPLAMALHHRRAPVPPTGGDG